ncbi:MAG: hypothetical protein M3433_03860 [Actinomycetota bacterium]|nr:hypothetical protein [Actinomycetota bacterium]
MSVREAPADSLAAAVYDEAWRKKLNADAEAIAALLPVDLREVHEIVVERAQRTGANALILSGSTVRGCRTEISDLDYHLVGRKIETRDLPRELDLHVLSKEKLDSDVLAGDDFVQWSLRFGCVSFDDGTVRRALELIKHSQPWPDVGRKREHAAKSLELARRFVTTGDLDGALVQVRTALSLTARARLLSEGVFPLARAELPAQLASIGYETAAGRLSATIYDSPSLTDLGAAVRSGEEVLAAVAEKPAARS